MYRTNRFSFKLNKEHERVLCMTEKTWSTYEKAMAYIKRFADVPWFAGATLEDEDGFVLYEMTSTKNERFHEKPAISRPCMRVAVRKLPIARRRSWRGIYSVA